jgi:hypothetical protein
MFIFKKLDFEIRERKIRGGMQTGKLKVGPNCKLKMQTALHFSITDILTSFNTS